MPSVSKDYLCFGDLRYDLSNMIVNEVVSNEHSFLGSGFFGGPAIIKHLKNLIIKNIQIYLREYGLAHSFQIGVFTNGEWKKIPKDTDIEP